nr:hypothetical protein Iba_chr07fCG3230 [Ipomoea batatas]
MEARSTLARHALRLGITLSSSLHTFTSNYLFNFIDLRYEQYGVTINWSIKPTNQQARQETDDE